MQKLHTALDASEDRATPVALNLSATGALREH